MNGTILACKLNRIPYTDKTLPQSGELHLFSKKFDQKSACLVICAALMISSPVHAETGLLAPVIEVHEAQENIGLAVVLMKDGAIVSENYLGKAVVEYDIEVAPDTRFQAMSVTKAFVGAALLKSWSAGLVDLDIPIQTYLPDFPKNGSGDITLRRLAAHTSGIVHLGHPDRKAVYLEHYSKASDSLETFSQLPLKHPPGTAYSYSSAGYTLIAAVLEKVHDKAFSAVLEDLILTPLGLDDTAPGNVLEPTPKLARNYSYIDIWTYAPSENLQQVPTWDFSYNVGGGNIVTTARDLARFGNAFIRPGFFTEQELALVYEPIDQEKSNWSYGWFATTAENGDKSLSISGATPGVQAGLVVDPQKRVALAALANSWGKNSAGGDLVVGATRRVIDSIK